MATRSKYDFLTDESSDRGVEAHFAGRFQRQEPHMPHTSPAMFAFCEICTTEVLPSEVTLLSPCKHYCCNSCLRDYLTDKICERTVDLTCPYYNCQTKLEGSMIKLQVGEEVYEKWRRFEQIEWLQKDVRLRWCPRPDCEGFDRGDENKRMLTCQVCSITYCYLCGKEWHGISSCEEEEMPLSVKFCPRCSIKVENAGSCSNVHCKRCNYTWCWECGTPFTQWHVFQCQFTIRSANIFTEIFVCFVLPVAVFGIIVFWTFKLAVFLLRRVPECRSRLQSATSVMILITLSVLLLPISIPVLLVFNGFVRLHTSIDYESPEVLKWHAPRNKLWYVCSFAAGLLISLVNDCIVLLFIALAPALGLILLLWVITNCCRKYQPIVVKNAVPGYRIGREMDAV